MRKRRGDARYSKNGDISKNISGIHLKKGPWSAREDAILVEHVQKHGEGHWNSVQRSSGLARCGKSCRLRWANHLQPNLKRGPITKEEEEQIVRLHAKIGNKWARMATELPGRTDNEIKNFWNTRLKKSERAGVPIYPPGVSPVNIEGTQNSNTREGMHGRNTSEPDRVSFPFHIPIVEFENLSTLDFNRMLNPSVLSPFIQAPTFQHMPSHNFLPHEATLSTVYHGYVNDRAHDGNTGLSSMHLSDGMDINTSQQFDNLMAGHSFMPSYACANNSITPRDDCANEIFSSGYYNNQQDILKQPSSQMPPSLFQYPDNQEEILKQPSSQRPPVSFQYPDNQQDILKQPSSQLPPVSFQYPDNQEEILKQPSSQRPPVSFQYPDNQQDILKQPSSQLPPVSFQYPDNQEEILKQPLSQMAPQMPPVSFQYPDSQQDNLNQPSSEMAPLSFQYPDNQEAMSMPEYYSEILGPTLEDSYNCQDMGNIGITHTPLHPFQGVDNHQGIGEQTVSETTLVPLLDSDNQEGEWEGLMSEYTLLGSVELNISTPTANPQSQCDQSINNRTDLLKDVTHECESLNTQTDLRSDFSAAPFDCYDGDILDFLQPSKETDWKL